MRSPATSLLKAKWMPSLTRRSTAWEAALSDPALSAALAARPSAADRRLASARGPLPPAAPGLRVGLLGGSFNPPHDGHRYISEIALKRLGLHQVWWLVAPQNPLKPRAGMAGLATRLAAARRVAASPQIRVYAVERRLGTQYTVDTLGALRARLPGVHFVWLMGADNLAQFHRWHAWRRLARTVPLAVIDRAEGSVHGRLGKAAQVLGPYRVAAEQARSLALKPPPAWCFLSVPPHPASATAIRQGSGAAWWDAAES